MNYGQLYLDLLDLEKEIQTKNDVTQLFGIPEKKLLDSIFWVEGYVAGKLNEERREAERKFSESLDALTAATIDLAIEENVSEEDRQEAEAFKERFLASLIRMRERHGRPD